MKIFFYGGRNAGMAVLLGVKAAGHDVVGVIAVDHPVKNAAHRLSIPVLEARDVNSDEVAEFIRLNNVDVFLCCHGRKIIKKELLGIVPAINVHPLLFKYPGAAPIARMLAAGETRASVAVHWMTEHVDRGEVIVENFVEVTGKTEIEVYNELYHLYVSTCLDALDKVNSNK